MHLTTHVNHCLERVWGVLLEVGDWIVLLAEIRASLVPPAAPETDRSASGTGKPA